MTIEQMAELVRCVGRCVASGGACDKTRTDAGKSESEVYQGWEQGVSGG